MPKLNQIIDTLNDRLQAGQLKGNAFQRGKFYGLTTPYSNDEGQVVPVEWSSGNPVDVTIDDSLTFQIYHKTTSASYGQPEQFTVPTAYQVSAVVFYNDDFVKLIPQDLAHLIRCEMHKPLTKTELGLSGLSSVTFTPTNANFDSYGVFASEYPNYENNLQLNKKLFVLNYVVTVTSNCNCIDCDSCE